MLLKLKSKPKYIQYPLYCTSDQTESNFLWIFFSVENLFHKFHRWVIENNLIYCVCFVLWMSIYYFIFLILPTFSYFKTHLNHWHIWTYGQLNFFCFWRIGIVTVTQQPFLQWSNHILKKALITKEP